MGPRFTYRSVVTSATAAIPFRSLLRFVTLGRRKTLKEIEERLFEYLESGGQASFNVRHDVQMLGTRALVDKLLSHLPERSRNVLADRYGLWDGIAETLEDIGDKLGLTRERIRQIEAKSLKRLRRIIGSSLEGFITTKATANMGSQHGFLNEEELVRVFSDDCGSDEAAVALNLLRDLEGVTDLFGRGLVEVEPGVYCASAETASEYTIGVALIQATLASHTATLNRGADSVARIDQAHSGYVSVVLVSPERHDHSITMEGFSQKPHCQSG
jgi:hypothetical protein